MKHPLQAVIFCGGLGTRLRPITNSLPKPMVPILDKPFLEYLLLQLSSEGIKRFILLTGYMGEIIHEYFGDGSKWGWSIKYSNGPKEWDTGRRLWETRSFLEDKFLLLYSDNFIQFDLNKLTNFYYEKKLAVSLLLAPKKNGNIKVSYDGSIEAYIKNRTGNEFNYVEVGYMIIERDYIFSLYSSHKNSPDISFTFILEKLVKNKQIGGLIVHDPYHSISDQSRLELMRDYLAPKKIILIDRDGVINEKAPQGQYIRSWKEFEWIEDTVQSMRYLADQGFSFIVITNQAGIARGMVSEKELISMHKLMVSELDSKGIKIHDIFVCPHHWNENCNCRKPKAGLFFQISKKYMLRMDTTLYIGDDIRDVEAAYNAGCGSVLISSKKQNDIQNKPKHTIRVNKLSDAIRKIEAYMNKFK
jgi:histidinol-phosphate phosphatase family protein